MKNEIKTGHARSRLGSELERKEGKNAEETGESEESAGSYKKKKNVLQNLVAVYGVVEGAGSLAASQWRIVFVFVSRSEAVEPHSTFCERARRLW